LVKAIRRKHESPIQAPEMQSAFHPIAQRTLSVAAMRVCNGDCLAVVFDCRMTDDPATINNESTNENNTDVDRWADARRLRINGKPCSKPWRCLNLNMRLPETLADGPLLWLRRRCKRISS
jgi:hypothetical protein